MHCEASEHAKWETITPTKQQRARKPIYQPQSRPCQMPWETSLLLSAVKLHGVKTGVPKTKLYSEVEPSRYLELLRFSPETDLVTLRQYLCEACTSPVNNSALSFDSLICRTFYSGVLQECVVSGSHMLNS